MPWKALDQMCSRSALGQEPRKVLDEIDQIQTVEAVLPTRCGKEIRKCCVTRPTEHQAILLQKLGLRMPRSLEAVKM